jgi:hypothetical protein
MLCRKLWLGYLSFSNRQSVQAATNPKVHLAIAIKPLQITPDVPV